MHKPIQATGIFHKGLAIWLLGASFFLIEYFVRISPSVMAPQLMEDFHTNALGLGSLSAFFYYAYIMMQIPAGIMVDRYGPSKLLQIASLLCAIGSILFALTGNLQIATFSRFMIGFGSAFAFVCTLKVLVYWFDIRYFALFAGLTQALGMIGAAIGDAPMALLFHHYGWRHTMLGVAVLFFVIFVMMLLILRDTPKGSITKKPVKLKALITSIKNILSHPPTWINCFFIGLLYGPTAVFAGMWGVSFIHHAYHTSDVIAASEMGMVFIGLAIGCPIMGSFSNYIKKRVLVMRFSALMSLVMLTAIIYGHDYLVNLTGLTLLLHCMLFLYGFFNSGIIPSYALAAEINDKHYSGTALGLTNMASVCLGAIFIPIIGYLVGYYSHTSSHNPNAILSVYAFDHAFLLLPICLLLAFALTFWIKETHCKNIFHKRSHHA